MITIRVLMSNIDGKKQWEESWDVELVNNDICNKIVDDWNKTCPLKDKRKFIKIISKEIFKSIDEITDKEKDEIYDYYKKNMHSTAGLAEDYKTKDYIIHTIIAKKIDEEEDEE